MLFLSLVLRPRFLHPKHLAAIRFEVYRQFGVFYKWRKDPFLASLDRLTRFVPHRPLCPERHFAGGRSRPVRK